MNFIKETDRGVELNIRALPNAKKNAFTGIWNGTHLKVSINAPALDGKANDAIIAFLSKQLRIRKSAIHLLSGDTCREKRFLITDAQLETILPLLPEL